MDSDNIKRMSIEEFIDLGYLQELNRQFLHPRGLALEAIEDDNGRVYLSGIWDYRHEPDGLAFDNDYINSDEALEKKHNIEQEFLKHCDERMRLFGNVDGIQPVAKFRPKSP